MNIQTLLKLVVEKNASDLHIATNRPPLIRLDGDLQELNDNKLTPNAISEMVQSIIPETQQKNFKEKLDYDFSYTLSDIARFRVNIYHDTHGLAIAFRTIPHSIPTFEALALPETFKKFCKLPNGIVLVTGPTGSGKSTTLAAMINEINTSEQKHILTIEDPIEFYHESKNCLINQREVGQHTASFEAALRSALREDPDIILIGEMRDLETIRLALTAAETGHLVFATLHTNSAAKTINRIIDVFPAGEKEMVRSMLSESLCAVIAQTLLKRIAGGRVAARETMICIPAIRNLIRENKIPQIYSAIQTGQSLGMSTLAQDIERLVAAGTIESPSCS